MIGNYVNPGSGGFSRIRNDIYVDKTGLIGLLNQTIDTSRCLTCISRPRRFGKSFAAKMLCAYYDKTCNSADLFDDLEIAQDTQYQKYMNRYDVIYLDMTGIIGEASITDVVPYIQRNVTRELAEQYPGLKIVEGFTATLVNAAEIAGNKFVMIIDEWDAPIREAGGLSMPKTVGIGHQDFEIMRKSNYFYVDKKSGRYGQSSIKTDCREAI